MKNLAKISILVTMLIALVSNVNASIVVAHDVNTLASQFGGPNEQQFAINVASWLIGSNSGNILAIESNPGDITRNYAPAVKTALRVAGYDVSYESNPTTITNLTLEDLLPFDAVFSGMTWSSQAAIDPMVLADYVNMGGHVYVYSGTGSWGFHAVEASKHNPFLEQFGLVFDTSGYTQQGTVSISSSHPIFDGITGSTLGSSVGQSIIDIGTHPFAEIVQFSGTEGVYAVVSTVPIPLLYSPVTPCRIVDTRKTSAGIIGASTQRNYRVFGSSSAINAQGGNPAGCPSPLGQPLAAHINMVAVNPTGKGNLQAFPVGAGTGAGLSVNYNTIDTNLANAGSVKAITGTGPDITVASNFSSAHTVIDVLGYYHPDEGFYYTPVAPCRIVDTRNTPAGIIDANTQRNFDVFGPVGDQGGNPAGCPSTLGVSPEAAHLNMVAVDPTSKGNLQAFPVGAGTGAGLSVNYNTIDTNLANAGTVKTSPDITVASNFSSAHTVLDVLGYYSEEEDLLYTPVSPCRIVDTRKTSAGIINANTQRDFRVFGPVSVQGGNSSGCSAPMGEPLAAHINMVAVNPTGKGNLQSFPVGAGKGAGLSVNYNTIDTNLANAGTVKTVTGSGADITVASNFSSAHTVIDVLGYYYPAP